MFRALSFIALTLLGLSAKSNVAEAAFPESPIRLVVPVAAGGNIDVMARVLAERLSQQLGQRVIVENITGAGGSLAARAVATAQPDGYTLLFQGPGQAALPFVYKKLPYDGVKDFVGVSMVGRYPLVAVINANLPAKTLAEFLALAKANPGKYSFGSSGFGGVSHLAAEQFKYLAGVEMIHVPFRGNNPAMVALLGGQIDLLLDGIAAQREYIDQNRVRLLGVATREFVGILPTVPVIADVLPGYYYPMWLAVFAPSKTPSAIVERISLEIATALKDSNLQKRFNDLMLEPISSTPESLDTFFQEQLKFHENLIKRAKISPVD